MGGMLGSGFITFSCRFLRQLFTFPHVHTGEAHPLAIIMIIILAYVVYIYHIPPVQKMSNFMIIQMVFIRFYATQRRP